VIQHHSGRFEHFPVRPGYRLVRPAAEYVVLLRLPSVDCLHCLFLGFVEVVAEAEVAEAESSV